MIFFLNSSSIPFKKDLIAKAVEFVLQKEKVSPSDLSVIFVPERRIKELNRKYRGENEATNVLSFEGDKDDFLKVGLKPELGEIFICPEFIAKESKKKKIKFKEEIIRVLIHGILHLLGYNHSKKREADEMFRKQEFYLRNFLININRS